MCTEKHQHLFSCDTHTGQVEQVRCQVSVLTGGFWCVYPENARFLLKKRFNFKLWASWYRNGKFWGILIVFYP